MPVMSSPINVTQQDGSSVKVEWDEWNGQIGDPPVIGYR